MVEVGPRPGWMTGEPPKVEYRQEVRVSAKLDKIDRGFWQNIEFGIKKILRRHQRDFKRGGYALHIDVDSIREMATRLNLYGNNVFKGTLDVVGGWLNDIVFNANEKLHREVFQMIGKSARKHMRDSAYRDAPQRRGGPLFTSPFKLRRKETRDGGVIYVTQMEEMIVGRWKGAYGVWRTGWLHDSIGYQVLMDPDRPRKRGRLRMSMTSARAKKDYKERRELAVGLLVGPGAGKRAAPPYAQAVNDGKAPVDGKHFVPNPRKYGKTGQWGTKLGYLAKGGFYPGTEGKFYMEETAQWLVRDTPRIQNEAKKFAHIYVQRAIREFMSEAKGQLARGVGFDFSDRLIKDLEAIVTMWLGDTMNASTKLIVDKVKAALAGEQNI
jgi:hypothetical protein